MTQKIKNILSDFSQYWNIPMPGRYMTFKEIAAYSGGGIGAYMIITLGTACMLATTNTLLSSTLGIDPTDMYIMYVIAILANIPLTGIRANIIDNTRNKAGKYRPYIVTMAIPTAIICILMVWFPYDSFGKLFGDGIVFGESISYVVKCTLVMIFNLLLYFFYNFFYDAYENLIHVLSPNTQERADVSSVKSVVYSFAPTVVNLITPIIAQNIFKTNTTDIRVYRLLYPILAVLGILLCIVVYKYTEEKIVQARTHVVQIKFLDALKAVAKNKYFWIISLASWIGFLEIAYSNILYWVYNYGGACSGNQYGLIYTIYGNASLWGMLLAPFCIRKWGKKAVLVVTNIFNIIFILMMLPFTIQIDGMTIWMILLCLYLNAFMGSFAHILNPAIQADIRDYQQYKTGERIDGMFSAVATIGQVIALITSGVLPIVYEKGGITRENAASVTSNPTVLDRMLGDGKTVGQILAEQLASGQDNYTNAYSALYDLDVLLPLLRVLIIVAAVGALMNVIPYFWYDFNEKKQKSVVSVLRIRAMFEDYGNGIRNDRTLVEAIDIIRESRELAKEETVVLTKADKKNDKKAYKEALKHNEDIEIAKFVCDELDKFSTDYYKAKLEAYNVVYKAGLEGLYNMKKEDILSELSQAKALPKNTEEEKELRKFRIEIAKNKLSAHKAIVKHYKSLSEFVSPDYSVLEAIFEREDALDEEMKLLYLDKAQAKKDKDSAKVVAVSVAIAEAKNEMKALRDKEKAEMDKHAHFSSAAKPYLDAEKLIKEKANHEHFDEIAEQYEEAKAATEAQRLAQIEEQKRLEEEKAAAKAAKKVTKSRK